MADAKIGRSAYCCAKIKHLKLLVIHSFVRNLIVFATVSCAATKTPYVSGDTEPGDLPPSPRYGAMMMALRDELPRHADTKEFFLCQSRGQVAALKGVCRTSRSSTLQRPIIPYPQRGAGLRPLAVAFPMTRPPRV